MFSVCYRTNCPLDFPGAGFVSSLRTELPSPLNATAAKTTNSFANAVRRNSLWAERL